MLFVVAALAVDLVVSNTALELGVYTLAHARLPAAFDGFRIVHLSDWHAAEFGPGNRDLIEMTRRQAPDIIVLTGDFVQRLGELPRMEALCRGLMAVAPVYYVTGNHEWAGRVVDPLRAVLRETGVVYLDNDYVFLSRGGEQICLAGLMDQNGPRTKLSLSELTALARRGGDPFLVLLSHRYDRFSEYVSQRVDVVFAGHAHGGLIRLPFTDGLIGPGRVLFPRHTSGVTWEGATAMVTSRGLAGVGRWPLRLFNRPEVVSVTLTRPKGAETP
ncbi:MAG: metallophosphoesterase [Oscillospiraceae bacterium]|nr:metallophosphoesterase [Oscillospiraceae bacterium]